MIECKTTGPLFTNCYIVSNDKKECVVIDPGMSFGKTYDYIINNYTVKGILLTHAHIDHIDGLQYFINDDVPVYIGDN
ncbi:MAG: MBL fold metallo-hydrolase, partial [Acholeplasmatales bacterium]|nr:MBL fold metallo-hydrolase [Acholeplasmatales bacterium]